MLEFSFQGTVQAGTEENIGPKTANVAAGRKELHKEEPHNLPTYSSSNFINIVTDLIKALLGNSSVSTFQHTRHATIEEAMFSMLSVRNI
jgi:hypothetical protein